MNAARLEALLQNWIVLNDNLLDISEKGVVQLLEYEQKHQNRITFVLRLHSRLNKMRRERERRAIASRVIKGVKK